MYRACAHDLLMSPLTHLGSRCLCGSCVSVLLPEQLLLQALAPAQQAVPLCFCLTQAASQPACCGLKFPIAPGELLALGLQGGRTHIFEGFVQATWRQGHIYLQVSRAGSSWHH